MHNGWVKSNSLHAYYYLIIKKNTWIDFDNECRYKSFEKGI